MRFASELVFLAKSEFRFTRVVNRVNMTLSRTFPLLVCECENLTTNCIPTTCHPFSRYELERLEIVCPTFSFSTSPGEKDFSSITRNRWMFLTE